jgi:hypothetical protein
MGTMASLASRKIALLWLSPGARTRRSVSHPPFAAVQGRTLDPTLLPRLRNRRQVTRHSKIDHGVRSPWSMGSRSRWPRSRSGSK